MEITLGEARPVPPGPPDGRRIAGLTVGGRTYHTAVEDESGYRFRFHELCEVSVSADLRRVVVSPDPTREAAMLPIPVAGNVIAFLLTVAGYELLHGSVVEVDGRAVAFVGHVGAGKSTLAAEACAAGARLVADDIVALELGDGIARCVRGGRSLRLRSDQAELARRLSPDGSRTWDGRTEVTVEGAREERPELAAIMLPSVSVDVAEPRVERLPQGEAFRVLSAFHRLVGLSDKAAVRRHFNACADLASRLPVLILTVGKGDAARGAAVATDARILAEGAGAS